MIKVAADLKVGDIFQPNKGTDLELTEKIRETGKTITFRLVIARSDLAPSQVGQPGVWRFRKGTEVAVA